MVNENLGTSPGEKRNFIVLTCALFMAFAFFGFSDTARGTAFPRIQDDLRISELQLALIMAVNSIGYLIATSFTAKLARKIGMKSGMVMALCIQACSGVLIFFTPGFVTLVAAFFILNIGNGMLDISTGVIAATTFTKRTGTMLNLTHSFYGLGMVLAPVVSAGLMTARFGGQLLTWRHMYLIILSFAIVPAIVAITGRLKKQDYDRKKTGYAVMLRKPSIWLTVMVLALGSTAEVGVVSWLPNFLEKAHGFTPDRAALYLTLCCVCLALTRLVIGPVIDKLGFINSLAIATGFAGAMITAGVVIGIAGAPLFIIAGIGIAPIFPTGMAVIARLFADEIDLAMTAIMTTIGIIMVPGGFLIGGVINAARAVFAESFGDASEAMAYSAGYLVAGLCCFGSCLFALILKKRQKKAGHVV